MKLIEIQKKLIASGLKVFSKIEFRRLMKASRVAAQKLLERYTRKDVLVRLKGGIYALQLNYPSGYLIANKLYTPSYISFETALSYYTMIPEVVYGFTSATTKTTRTFETTEERFVYHTIKKEAFTGYHLRELNGDNVLFAEKEKALADYLYFVFLKKKTINERMRIREIDKEKLMSYIFLYGRPQFGEWALCLLKNKLRRLQ